MTNFAKKYQNIPKNVSNYHVLISGLEVWGTYKNYDEAMAACDQAGEKYPHEIIWISTDDDPLDGLEEFGWGRSANGRRRAAD